MKIRSDDYQYLLEYLIRKRREGQEFVAFSDTAAPVDRDELYSFFNQDDARKFCHETSTDMDTYDYLAIRSAYRAMAEALKDKMLLIEKNGIVDVGLMVIRRYERLEVEQLINNQNSKVMNQKNFEYLRDQVKYTGFGESLEESLKEKLSKQSPDFTLTHTAQYGNDIASSTLQFSKSKQSDMYFFNFYKVNLQRENVPDAMEQTFYINKGNNVTLKEAYNLMSGRAVNKDLTNKNGELYNAWVQFDFKQTDNNGNYKLKQFHQNYGYDLDSILSKHPIKELGNEEYKSNLMDSLKKGNRQSATLLKDGTEQKIFIEANPRYKSINMYDSSMQRMINSQSKSEKQVETKSESAKQESKKESPSGDSDSPELPQPAKKKRRKQSIS